MSTRKIHIIYPVCIVQDCKTKIKPNAIVPLCNKHCTGVMMCRLEQCDRHRLDILMKRAETGEPFDLDVLLINGDGLKMKNGKFKDHKFRMHHKVLGAIPTTDPISPLENTDGLEPKDFILHFFHPKPTRNGDFHVYNKRRYNIQSWDTPALINAADVEMTPEGNLSIPVKEKPVKKVGLKKVKTGRVAKNVK